jgi:hypothetical protein
MSVIVMQRFAIDHDIKASTELKKEEIIEYILANAKETKEAYFIPDSPQVYEQEVEQVQKHVDEVLKPEVVIVPEEVKPEIIEEVSEEVVEEKPEVKEEIEPVVEKVEEEKVVHEVYQEQRGPVQYVQQSIDLTDLIQEIRMLRETIEGAIKQPEIEMIEEVTVPEEKPVVEKSEPVVINTAEFYGKPKSLKKIIKKEEVDEREKFVEEKKASSSIGTDKESKDEKAPAELRFFKKVGVGLGKFLWKLLKVILKIALIAALIILVLFVLYGVLAYFTDLAFLAGVDAWLNSLFGEYGLLTLFTDLLGKIFG